MAVMATYQLAQLNIASMIAPLDSPTMAEFVAQLAPINALADESEGFVWRLIGDGDDATSLRPFPDPQMLVNMSVWESLEALSNYAYKSDHRGVLQRRRQWFAPMATPSTVLWWVPHGHQPSVVEAKDRLEHLTVNGPTAYAFTFRQPFPPPQS